MVTVASGVVVSGLISHFETSNYVPEGTYFFYTVSGIVSFYQKNPDECKVRLIWSGELIHL